MRRGQTYRGAYATAAKPWVQGLLTLLLAAVVPSPLYAHGFGQRYDLPVPLWLYLLGAGATVGFSFLVVGALLPARRSADQGLRLALPSGGVVGRSIVLAVRIAAVVLFVPLSVWFFQGMQSLRPGR